MFQKLKSAISQFIYYGITSETPFIESEKIYIYNLLMIIAFPLQISYTVYNLFQGKIGLFFINFLQFSIFLTGYITVTKSNFKYLRSVIIFFSSLVTAYAAIHHKDGIEFILIPVILAALIIYDSVWLFILHTIISLGAIIFVRYMESHVNSLAEFLSRRNVNFIVSLTLLIIVLIAFKRFYQKQQLKIEESNKQLKLHSEKLERINIELDRFAFVASHDLQEPLRMVINFLNLFEKKYKPVVDEDGKKYIHFAVDGALRMKELIRDLLQYSRVGSASLEIETVDMNAIMKEVLLLFRNDLFQTNVSVNYTDLPIIKAGRTAMIQLMQNLISNAIKFNKEKQTEIIVQGEQTDTEWIISVKDNGIGIESEYFEKIFIVFQRLHRKDEYPGTGIGLSICKKIIERYHGRIWVESELGNGSCFKFSIPKNPVI